MNNRRGPRAPETKRGVPYREAIDELQRLYLLLIRVSETPRLPQTVRAELRAQASQLANLLRHDNGRSR